MFRLESKLTKRPLLLLGTIGARTGEPRSTVLRWFPDGDRDDCWVVIGSNGGATRHPGWVHNLARRPGEATVELGEGPFPVVAELVTGAEREAIWARVVEEAPSYRRYTDKTDRLIPVIRLKQP
jgi:deazaflavin-dependent oxidoreductase (nitroreductase family)